VASPVGDQLLSDFAMQLIVNEQLGQDALTDYLSVSYSGVDAVNHFFGPSSLENEDILRRLDQTLAELFDFIDTQIGLDHTLIVLSADHGIPDMPEFMTELGYPAGRLDPEEIISVANQAGSELGIDEVVLFFYRPYIYMDESKIRSAQLEPMIVKQAIASNLTQMDGINQAISTENLFLHTQSKLHDQVKRNQHISRSGDIYIIQEPYWFLFDEGPIPNMHGSPWNYDTHVPIMFMGPGIDTRSVHRLVHPVDVAPTIAALLGMTKPASAQGNILGEVLE
jgi:predicted AlkP superfamily pyrophosphatase or phosphodiesterase